MAICIYKCVCLQMQKQIPSLSYKGLLVPYAFYLGTSSLVFRIADKQCLCHSAINDFHGCVSHFLSGIWFPLVEVTFPLK